MAPDEATETALESEEMSELEKIAAACPKEQQESDRPRALPTAMDLLRAALLGLRRLEQRLEGARIALEAAPWDFEGEEDDTHVEQAVGLDSLKEAGEIVAELRRVLVRWCNGVAWGCGSVMQLDADMMIAVQKVVPLIPAVYRRGCAEKAVRGALMFLADHAEAAHAIALGEQRRLDPINQRVREIVPNARDDRDYWPWTQIDRRPWPPLANGAPAADGTADETAQPVTTCDSPQRQVPVLL